MFAVAVQTRTARRKGESQKLYAAKETGFDNRAPLWERRIPQYDAMKDPSGSRRPRRYCRMFTGPMPVDLTAVSRASSARRRAPDQRALRSDVPGAPETYGSIAAAFDFEHHEHTDPAAELVALKAILAREALLSQLEVLSEDLVRRAHRAWALREVPPPLDAPTRRAAVDLMCRLRRATLDVCEAIGTWREISDAPELAFVWHGRDYALKMARSDMDFVASIEPLAAALGVEAPRMRRNPLMLPRTAGRSGNSIDDGRLG